MKGRAPALRGAGARSLALEFGALDVLGRDLRCRISAGQANDGIHPQFGRADDRRVEDDDPDREADRERLDLVAGARREHEEGEHEVAARFHETSGLRPN